MLSLADYGFDKQVMTLLYFSDEELGEFLGSTKAALMSRTRPIDGSLSSEALASHRKMLTYEMMQTPKSFEEAVQNFLLIRLSDDELNRYINEEKKRLLGVASFKWAPEVPSLSGNWVETYKFQDGSKMYALPNSLTLRDGRYAIWTKTLESPKSIPTLRIQEYEPDGSYIVIYVINFDAQGQVRRKLDFSDSMTPRFSSNEPFAKPLWVLIKGIVPKDWPKS